MTLRVGRGLVCGALALGLGAACKKSPPEPPEIDDSGAQGTTPSSTSASSSTASTLTGTGSGGGPSVVGPALTIGAVSDGAGGSAGGESDVGGVGGSACVEINQEARVIERPVDIIFIIDNSGSMTEEIDQVKARINQDFAQIIGESEIDYRVIVFSKYGPSALELCVTAPLGGDDCSAPVVGAPNDNPPRLFYYDYMVSSLDSLCLLLDRWDEPDLSGRPGWSNYLRVGAYKVFVEVTDDGVGCGAFSDLTADPNDAVRSAREFDAALRGLSLDHFGVKLQRTYSWFSIVGIAENVPPDEPWPAVEDGESANIQTGMCSSAASPGLAYQVLSIATGALRWPICRNDDFSAMFQAIATNVVQKASVSCDWDLPDPPEGKVYDASKLGISYTASGSAAVDLPRAEDAGACGTGWYVDDAEEPRFVALCPDTCAEVRADDGAELNINVPCESLIDDPE